MVEEGGGGPARRKQAAINVQLDLEVRNNHYSFEFLLLLVDEVVSAGSLSILASVALQ